MFLDINLSSSENLLLGICYRPPKVGHLTDFENVLLRFLPGYSRVLVTGDFNTNLLMTIANHDYQQLTTMFRACNMTILPLDATHHTATSHTLIDLMVASDLDDVMYTGQVHIPAVSRHDLIFCVLNLKPPKPKENALSIEILSEWMKLHSSQTLLKPHGTPLNLNLVLQIYDKHAPVVVKRVNKRKPVPWITEGILKMMALRDSVHRRARRTGDEAVMGLYHQLCNRVKQSLRNSRLRSINTLFSDRKQSSASMWRNVKSLGLGKQ